MDSFKRLRSLMVYYCRNSVHGFNVLLFVDVLDTMISVVFVLG